MPQTEKLAISLPADLVRKIETMRKKTGETRSAFIRRSLEQSFKGSEREKRIKAYVEGYQSQPDTDEEIAEAQAAAEALAREPW